MNRSLDAAAQWRVRRDVPEEEKTRRFERLLKVSDGKMPDMSDSWNPGNLSETLAQTPRSHDHDRVQGLTTGSEREAPPVLQRSPVYRSSSRWGAVARKLG